MLSKASYRVNLQCLCRMVVCLFTKELGNSPAWWVLHAVVWCQAASHAVSSSPPTGRAEPQKLFEG